MGELFGVLVGFVVLLVVLVALRVWTQNRIEVKTSDMVLALVPIALWLFTSGRIQELTVGDVKIVAAIKQASTSPVGSQVTRLPVDLVRADPKEGLSFRYVVINRADGILFGLLDSRQLTSLLKAGSGQVDPERFAEWLNRSSTTELSSLPGFIPAKSALQKTSETRAALERMNALDVQSLPVVDEAGRFVGVVDRSKLSASMLIDIAAKVSR